MIDIKDYVYQHLSMASAPVHYHYPPENTALPCISYYEAENRVYAQTDTKEHLSEISFVVDIWSKNATKNAELGLEVDTALSDAGFKRMFAYDLYEPETKVHHKTMRYRVLSTQDGELYQ